MSRARSAVSVAARHSASAGNSQRGRAMGLARRLASLSGCDHRRPRSWQSARSGESTYGRWPRGRYSSLPDRRTTAPKRPSANTSMGTTDSGGGPQQVENSRIHLSFRGQAGTNFLKFCASGSVRTTGDSTFLRTWSGQPVREYRCRGRREHPGPHRCNRCWKWWRQFLPSLSGRAP